MTTEPARRFVLAQSWWVASELARRHPGLLVIETHPAEGTYDCLSLVDPAGPTTVVQLNRAGGLHAGGSSVMTWNDVITATDAHHVVKEIERAAELTPPLQTPATIARTLTYRVLARVLAATVDDRQAWDARNGRRDSAESPSQDRPELQAFPSVVDGLRDRRSDDLLGLPAYRFWLLQRGDETVAVLDTDGRVHQRNQGPVALMPLYDGLGRRLTATIGAALGHLLS